MSGLQPISLRFEKARFRVAYKGAFETRWNAYGGDRRYRITYCEHNPNAEQCYLRKPFEPYYDCMWLRGTYDTFEEVRALAQAHFDDYVHSLLELTQHAAGDGE